MDNKQYGWDNLPTPDEEQSWQKTKALLDKEDDDRVPPPVFFRTCAGWGLFGIALLTGLWFIINPIERWGNKQTVQKEKEQTVASKQNGSNIQTQNANTTTNNNITTKSNSNHEIAAENQNNQTAITSKTSSSENNKVNIAVRNNKNDHSHKQATSKSSIAKTNKTKNKKATSVKDDVVSKNKRKDNKTGAIAKTNEPLDMPDGFKAGDNPIAPTATFPADSTEKISINDTAQNTISKPDTTSKTESLPTEEKKQQQKKKAYYIIAGLGLQQQIPISGQDAFPYNYYGRKGSLSDYIPSAYVRLHKENKWFIQAEFRYGAPQANCV
jgi:hypothetical protein